MGKWCPITKTKVVYLECLECEDKECQSDTSDIPTHPLNKSVKHNHDNPTNVK